MPVAIITGAGSGIGRAAALTLARQHYQVALVGRTPEPLQRVAAEVQSGGGAALVVPADVSRHDHVDQMVKRVVAAWSRIDALVNCAGDAPSLPLRDITPEQWRHILDANLSSAFYTTRAVWSVMRRQHQDALELLGPSGKAGGAAGGAMGAATGGVIVNISSMAGRDPFPGLGAYGCAKAALDMLTLAAAREGEADGIRVVGVAPGAVDTPMFRRLVGEQNVDPGEVLVPQDVADVVAQALGDSGALRCASGETIYVHRRPA